MNLLQINHGIEELLNQYDPETGEALFDIEAFEELQATREEKLDNLFKFIINQQAFADACKAEEKAIAERRQRAERQIARLKEYALMVMGDSKRITPLYTAQVRTSERVEVEPEFVAWAKRRAKHLLRYKSFEQIKAYKEPEPDKAAIKALLKAGTAVKGCSIEKNVTLSVK